MDELQAGVTREIAELRQLLLDAANAISSHAKQITAAYESFQTLGETVVRMGNTMVTHKQAIEEIADKERHHAAGLLLLEKRIDQLSVGIVPPRRSDA